MTTTDTAIKTKWTLDELHAEARRRFGDQKAWAFKCPQCGDVATQQDFIDASADRNTVGQECIGRVLKGKRGCNYAAYGLIPGPWTVTVPAGVEAEREVRAFPLADAPAKA